MPHSTVLPFSGVTFILCFIEFRFRLLPFIDLSLRPFVQSFFDIMRPAVTRVQLTTVCVFFFCLCFCFFENVFFSYYAPLSFSSCMERTPYVFPFRMVYFYLVTGAGLWYQII